MSLLPNPHKRFQFNIFVFGMNPIQAQKVTTPEHSIDVVEHGEGNHLVKTAGMAKFGTIQIEKISPSDIGDTLFWDWIRSIQDAYIGGGLIPEMYKRPVTIQLLGTNMRSVTGRWDYDGCWPSRINGVELDRVSSETTVTSIELQVDRGWF